MEKSFIAEEAAAFFKEQEEATNLPYIYLSAGVSAKLFQETLVFAHEAGANFNGVLCGQHLGWICRSFTSRMAKQQLVNGSVQKVVATLKSSIKS